MGESPLAEAISYWYHANEMAQELKALLIIEEALRGLGCCRKCLKKISAKRQKSEEDLGKYLEKSDCNEKALAKAREFGLCWGKPDIFGERITFARLKAILASE